MKVKFLPQNLEIDIEPGQSILEVAHANGVPIRSTCNGMPSCAECRVRVVDGEYNLLPPSKKEISLIGNGYYIDQRRLSCQMHCYGDVSVDTTEHMERAEEGPITKKFLSRVHKSSAQDSHSVGGVLIEQEESMLKEISQAVSQGGGGGGGAGPKANADFLGGERAHRPNRGGGAGGGRQGGNGGGGGERQGGGGRNRGRRRRR
jgi:ferredoxin